MDQNFTICPWSLPWDRPSSWPHSKTMQTDANRSNYGIVWTSTGGRRAKGLKSDKTVCLITFDRVCGYSSGIQWHTNILLSWYACAMLCNYFPPCGCKFGSPALIVEPLHATVSGTPWSFGFLCFLLSNVCLNATCPARSKPLQCPSTHWFIDRNIVKHRWSSGCGCCRNVRTVSLDYQLPTTRMIKNKEN